MKTFKDLYQTKTIDIASVDELRGVVDEYSRNLIVRNGSRCVYIFNEFHQGIRSTECALYQDGVLLFREVSIAIFSFILDEIEEFLGLKKIDWKLADSKCAEIEYQ